MGLPTFGYEYLILIILHHIIPIHDIRKSTHTQYIRIYDDKREEKRGKTKRKKITGLCITGTSDGIHSYVFVESKPYFLF